MDEFSFFAFSAWSWDPIVMLAIGLAAGIYVYALQWYRRDGEIELLTERGLYKPIQPWYFALGLLTIFIALQSPIDTLSGQLFTMHMIQHLMLALVAPPLLLLGMPEALINPLINLHPIIKPVLRQVTAGTAAFFIFNIVLIVWHIPFLYELTLQYEPIHNIEHAMFFWTGVLSWWPILSPTRLVPRLSYPNQILYIFLVATPGAILGAWLVFSNSILYPSYAAFPSVWGMTTLEDQQMGGLIMMVPGKFVYFIALTIIFFLWFNSQNAPAGNQRTS